MVTQTIDRRAIPPKATESQWLANDGHAIRRIDWTRQAGATRGSILFFPGRGDAYEKYLETLQQWHDAGWNVTAADWRYQAGSGRGSADPHVGHVEDFGIWVDDLADFFDEWAAQHPGPHVLAAHSMGGHIVARALAEKRVAPDAVVLSAPMLDMKGTGLPRRFSHAVTRLMCRLGPPERPAWKVSEKPASPLAGRHVLLTHDMDRYHDEEAWWVLRPELVMGPASWRWVERAYASVRGLFAPGVLESIKTPVLILSTRADALVSHKAAKEAAQRMPHAQLIEFGSEARHELFREVDAVRDRALAAVTGFLDTHAPVSKG